MLEIEFTNGKVYSASDVSQAEYEGLMSSPSPGRFFAAMKAAYTFTQE